MMYLVAYVSEAVPQLSRQGKGLGCEGRKIVSKRCISIISLADISGHGALVPLNEAMAVSMARISVWSS